MAYFSMGAPLNAPGTADTPPAAHPIQRYGLIFGAVAGLVALVQVGVSVVSALENRYALTNLYYSASGGTAALASALEAVFPLVIATYISWLLGFVFALVLCWHAGRAAALETGRASAGTEAGLLVSVIGSLLWVIGSVVGVLLFHTDGSLAGIATASAHLSAATDAAEIAILVGQETFAIVVGLGAAALVGRLAGGAAVTSLRRHGAGYAPPQGYIAVPLQPYAPGPMLGEPSPPSAPQP
jgi:hypothetical protein